MGIHHHMADPAREAVELRIAVPRGAGQRAHRARRTDLPASGHNGTTDSRRRSTWNESSLPTPREVRPHPNGGEVLEPALPSPGRGPTPSPCCVSAARDTGLIALPHGLGRGHRCTTDALSRSTWTGTFPRRRHHRGLGDAACRHLRCASTSHSWRPDHRSPRPSLHGGISHPPERAADEPCSTWNGTPHPGATPRAPAALSRHHRPVSFHVRGGSTLPLLHFGVAPRTPMHDFAAATHEGSTWNGMRSSRHGGMATAPVR